MVLGSWGKKTDESAAQSGRPRRQPMPSSDLWDLIVDMDWPRVIEHARKHPEDAQWVDGHWHETPLYLACQHNPTLQALKAILVAYPESTTIRTRANHDLPLHIACRYQCSAEILRELLRDYPVTAVEQTRWGRTPLVALWEFRPNQENEAPSAEFWEKVEVILDGVARFREYSNFQSQVPRSRVKDFVRATPAGFSDDSVEDVGVCLVHAAVSLGALSCPLPILDHLLETRPKEVFNRDRRGFLPLQVALGPTAWSVRTRRKYKPRENEFIQRLIDRNPDAALTRILEEKNRLPVHFALANRHTWEGGINCLVQTMPSSLSEKDPVTGLFPFLLVAVPVGDTTVDLNTVYNLLRYQPDLLTRLDWSGKRKSTLSISRISPPTVVLCVSVATVILAIYCGTGTHTLHGRPLHRHDRRQKIASSQLIG